jgi:hypothetical protein
MCANSLFLWCKVLDKIQVQYVPVLCRFEESVTSSWDRASLYALWTGVSSGTGPFCDMVVALAIKCLCVSGFVFHGHLLMDSRVGTL